MVYYKASHDAKIGFKSAEQFLDFDLKAVAMSCNDYSKQAEILL